MASSDSPVDGRRPIASNGAPVFAWAFILAWMGALLVGTLAYATRRSSHGPAYVAGGAILGCFWLGGLAAAGFFLRIQRTTVRLGGPERGGPRAVAVCHARGPFSRAEPASVVVVEDRDSDGDPYFVCRLTTPSGRVVNVAEGHRRDAVEDVRRRLCAGMAPDAGCGAHVS